MKVYLYVPLKKKDNCWIYSVNTGNSYNTISIKTMLASDDFEVINILNKDNLDRALLLISLGLPNKEIEELLKE